MSVEFKSSPYANVLIHCGLKPNTPPSETQNQLKAVQKALEPAKKSFEQYEENLQSDYPYGKFLKDIDKSIKILEKDGIPQNIRSVVATKLADEAKKEIDKEDQNFLWIHRFFHIIGQSLLKGRWGYTKGQWGMKRATDLKELEHKNFKNNLQKCISKYFINLTEKIKKQIKNLSEEQCKTVLQEIVFPITTSDFNWNNTYVFFDNLTEENKKLFYEMLLSKDDWFLQATNLMCKTSNENTTEQFITEDMVKRFQDNLKQVCDAYKNIKLKKHGTMIFFNILVVKAIKNYLAQNDTAANQAIYNLLNPLGAFAIDNQGRVQGHQLLKAEEKKKLEPLVSCTLT